MKVNEKTIVVDQKELKYTHIVNGSDTICYLFSGAGYTYDKPLLYYSTMAMLEKQYDVVHVHYSFQQDVLKLPLEEITELIYQDVAAVISDVEKEHEYQETIFLGKSLGTIPIINKIMKNRMYLNSKMILLTPLLKFEEIFNALIDCNHIALIVIGDKDPHYISEKIKAVQTNPKLKIEVVPGSNHSLDIDPFDTIDTIKSLTTTIETIKKFIDGN